MKKATILHLTTTLLLFSGNISSQVTIGSGIKPVSGALLDLKDETVTTSPIGGASAQRGLGLPRVELEKLDQLFPMFTNDSDYVDGTTKNDIDEKHIGLLVYNTSMCIGGSSMHPEGMYVWGGTVWEQITKPEFEHVIVYQDQDGKDFKARLFADAGIWMVENISVTKFADGTLLPVSPSNASNTAAALWCYPGTNNLDATLFNLQPSLGLLYNWYAATNGKEAFGVDEAGTNEGARVQGICPNGWHLPSDKEWTDLENEIIKNTSLYSTMPNIGAPLLAYDRPSGATTSPHGKAMKAECMIASSSLPNAYGASLPAYRGGFDAYLGGFSPSSQLYGQASYFWTSSSSSNINGAWNRRINAVKDFPAGNMNPETVVSRTSQGRQLLTSIRCKKDTNTP